MHKGLRLLLVLGLLLVGVAAPATSAQAGTTCAYPFCSETENRLSSGNYVMMARNWCGSGTRRLINTPPCGSGDQVKFLSSGQDTPFAEDWDTFRVEVGCVVTMKLYDYLPLQNWNYVTVDNRGSSRSLWVKVADDQTATIVSRSC